MKGVGSEGWAPGALLRPLLSILVLLLGSIEGQGYWLPRVFQALGCFMRSHQLNGNIRGKASLGLSCSLWTGWSQGPHQSQGGPSLGKH